MASYNEEFNQYRIFLENIAKSVVPQDSEVLIKAQHLRNRFICHSDAEGEVIYWILKFLDDKKCPTKLIAPIVRNVLLEIQDDPRYKDTNTDVYADLRGLATTILEGFCIRLLDNVELNKILDTATSHSAQQQLNDDLLPIPIRTAAASQNKRRKMEDRSICIDEFHKVYAMKDAQKSSFYGVFDGHIGYPAAQYAASQLPFNLSTDAVASTNPVDALYRAFMYTDEKFISKGITSGTTAACALYRPDEGRLYIAWVGDSKALLAKQHGKIMQLVTPHRPELEREKNRIHSLGGSVHFVQGAYRVNGSLNVTRSIGDINLKTFLISRPDCVLVELDKKEEFLVLATDGLWDYASETVVAKTVYDCIKEDCENLDQIPSRLIKLAQDGNSTDNISVVVLFFKQPSQIAKNCDNLTIMESEFDNIKEVDYYNSRNLYPSDENSTSNSHAIDAKQLRWSPNDNLNNIINEEVKQTETTTSSSTNNGQFDDNLLYSSDNIDLNQKLQLPPGTGSDDNNLHYASTLGDAMHNEFDNAQQKILEKNQPHQQLGDADADYGPETCVDVTDDVVMMTENSADTNNLLEQSTLSHSKDTLPSSDNCNPFDNKNTLDMEDANEFRVDAHLQLDDANKSTPLLSPEVEDLPLSSEGGLQFTNEGFQQSPLDEDIPAGIESHQSQVEFEEKFMQSNGHLSPVEVKDQEVEVQKSQSEFERFGYLDEEKVVETSDIPQQQIKLDESIDFMLPSLDADQVNKEVFGDVSSPQQTNLDEPNDFTLPSLDSGLQHESLEENSLDDNDFRSKDEEELLEKHAEAIFTDKQFKEPESEVLDLNQRDELQQTLQNLEDDVLEEKPILTGSFTEKQITEINFDDLCTQPKEERLGEFTEEKQDKEEFAEKEEVQQKSAEIELEEDECIHLEEHDRPSDYLAMLKRQQEENDQLCSVVEGFEKQAQFNLEQPQILDPQVEEAPIKEEEKVVDAEKLDAPHFEDDDRLSDKVGQLAREQEEYEHDERLSEKDNFEEPEKFSQQEQEKVADEQLEKLGEVQVHQEEVKLSEDQFDKEQQQIADDKLDEQIGEIGKNEHYDFDESVSVGTEQLEHERHLDDIDLMSQQIDRFEKEDQVEDQLLEQGREEIKTPTGQDSLPGEFKDLIEPVQVDEPKAVEEEVPGKLPEEDNKLQSEAVPESPVVDDLIAQPEKQCFEEPEKLEQEQEIENLLLQAEDKSPVTDEIAIEERENKLNEQESVDEPLFDEKVLAHIEQEIQLPGPPSPRPKEVKPAEEFDEEPENLVEVVEEIIIKEQVPIKPSAPTVSSQEPSAVPPTHESCDESEDDEWKYMKEGQGEKQLLGLQGDTVVEEETQQQLIDTGAPDSTTEATATTQQKITEQISTVASDQIETIKDTFESLTQNIADLAENAAALTEPAVDKIGNALENLNLSQSSTREKLDNVEDEDISASEMNSKLNPEAKEFIPTFSPTAAFEFANGFGIPAPTAIPHHFKDELLAQSPRKGRESNMENINIPAENEFEEEIANKPHGLPGDEAIIEHAENGGLYQEMNWKEAMHGSEKEEGPLVDSPLTEESLEVVDNVLQYGAGANLCDFSAPIGLDNAGMKQSIYIENNTSLQTPEEDVLNTVQVLPVESESKDNSFEVEPEKDAVTNKEVQDILTLAGDEKKKTIIDGEIEQKMEQLLLSHDKEITKDVHVEAEQVPINGVEMSPSKPEAASPTADETAPSSDGGAASGLGMGAVAAVAVAATTAAAVKKVEAEKNQKNLNKTSLTTKSKVPDTKKPLSGTPKTTTVSAVAAKRTSLADKSKPTVASTLANKKPTGGLTSRPRTAPVVGLAKTEKKTLASTTSTAKSRIDTKAPSTLTTRKPLLSNFAKTANSKPVDDAKSSSTTVKSSSSGKSAGSKTSVGSTKQTSATNSITKPRPATVSTVTNGTVNKTTASKPTSLAPKSAGHTKPSLTSPRSTLTSTLRKTEAIKRKNLFFNEYPEYGCHFAQFLFK